MTAAEGRRRESWGKRFAPAASVFLDKRLLIVLLRGFSSGLPLALLPYHAPLTLDSDYESIQREFPLG
jgi:hypothetical protein